MVACLNERYKDELALFDESDEQVLSWVNQFWNEMIAKKSIDRKTMGCPSIGKSGYHQA